MTARIFEPWCAVGVGDFSCQRLSYAVAIGVSIATARALPAVNDHVAGALAYYRTRRVEAGGWAHSHCACFHHGG